MRLIGPNGEQVGVIATSVALNLAKEANLDLVEVAPNAKPPVAKLIDYGKFKYNEKVKQRDLVVNAWFVANDDSNPHMVVCAGPMAHTVIGFNKRPFACTGRQAHRLR